MLRLRSAIPPVLLLSAGALLCATCGCNRPETYPSRPITIICPWAAGGGTDRVSRQMAMHLERELQVPVSVVNATGGKGVTGHNRGLKARPDGATLLMMTFELNTMHWMGLTDLTYRDAQPLISLNEDYAALLVAQDAEWQSLEELEQAVAQSPGQLTASGTAAGGAWHLALAGWLLSAELDAESVVWVPSAGANPSLQQLMSGGVDMVCCSLPEARALLEAGEVRALGVMSPKRAVGFEQIPTFPEQGREWTLGGWRGLAVPRETPPEIVTQLRETLRQIVSKPAQPGSFAQFMQEQKFDNTWREGADFTDFLAENDVKLGELLKNPAMQSVTSNRFSPMTYPTIILIGMAMACAGLWWDRRQPTPASPSPPLASAGSDDHAGAQRAGVWKFVAVLAGVALYALVAEQLGFLLAAGLLLLSLLLALGNRLVTSLAIAVLLVPSLYFVFATVLRVPLPQGWWG